MEERILSRRLRSGFKPLGHFSAWGKIKQFICGEKLLPEFLFYWFKANKPYLDAVANGSTYPELYISDLFEFEIGIPSLDE